MNGDSVAQGWANAIVLQAAARGLPLAARSHVFTWDDLTRHARGGASPR